MENQKIKFVRRSGNTEIYIDNILQEHTDSSEVRYAMEFFEAFTPELLLEKLTAQTENAVIVFRTSTEQMEKFVQVMQGNAIDSLNH